MAVLTNVLPNTLETESSPDGIVVKCEGQTASLRPFWAGEGFPADVRRVLDDVALEPDPHAGTIVVTARRLSPGAIRLLSELQVSWADAAGYAEISVTSCVYVSRREPRPLPRTAEPRLSWSRSAEAVVEYLLSRRTFGPLSAVRISNGVDRVAHIAEAVAISPAQVAKVLTALDDEGYTAKFGPERGPTASRELKDRGRLLSDWAGHYRRSARRARREDLSVLSRDPSVWSALVADRLSNFRWAVSGWMAADSIASFLTTLPDMTVYVPDVDFESAVMALTADREISTVERGGRIHLRSAPEYLFEFTRESPAGPLVSPVRVYGDLLRVGGRGVDAAEHLREVAIGF